MTTEVAPPPAPPAQRPQNCDALPESLSADVLASASASAGGEIGSRLDKRTHLDRQAQLDRGYYRITLRNYGQGLGEIGWSFVPVVFPGKSARGLSEQREMHEDRAIRRARSRIRQLILTTGADHLLTLTYRENITDFDLSCTHFSKFVRLVKGKLPGWIYIAVAEQQKRGAWHWHLAVCGRQDVNLLRAAWVHVVGDGNIDVKPPSNRIQNRQLALVSYLGKYLAKGFKDGTRELNGRRFRASRGIEVPAQYLTLPLVHKDNVRLFIEGQLVANTGTVGHVWQAEGKLAGWACSWK